MNHPFRSRRQELRICHRVLELLQDIQLLCDMTRDQRQHVVARTEALVEQEAIRAILLGRGARLGVLLSDADQLVSGADMHSASLNMSHGTTWTSLLTPDGAQKDALDALKADVDALKSVVVARKEDCETLEGNDGDASSSYSDYSDDSTNSEDSHGVEEYEDTESGETES